MKSRSTAGRSVESARAPPKKRHKVPATEQHRSSKSDTQSIPDEDGMSDVRGNGTEEDWEDEDDRMTQVSTKNKGDCGRRSDFKGRELELVDLTFSILISTLFRKVPFPTNQQYTQSIYASWDQACKTLKLSCQQYAIQKAHKESIRNRVNSFRGRLRDVMKDVFEVVHGFHNEKSSEQQIKRKVAGLLPNKLHQKPDSEPGTGWFAHEWVKRAICKIFFMGRHPVAIKFPRKWDPVPHRAVAVVCGFMMYYLYKWKDGKWPDTDVRPGDNAGRKRVKRMNYFDVHRFYKKQWTFMKRFRDSPAQRDRCAIVLSDLYNDCLKAVGQKPIDSDEESTDGDFSRNDEDDFAADEPTEEELGRIRRRSVSASGLRDAAGLEDDLDAEAALSVGTPASLDDDDDDALGLGCADDDDGLGLGYGDDGSLGHEGVGLDGLDDDDEDILGPSSRDSLQPATSADLDPPARQKAVDTRPASRRSGSSRADSVRPPKQKLEILIKTSKPTPAGTATPKGVGPRAALKSGRLKVVGAKRG